MSKGGKIFLACVTFAVMLGVILYAATLAERAHQNEQIVRNQLVVDAIRADRVQIDDELAGIRSLLIVTREQQKADIAALGFQLSNLAQRVEELEARKPAELPVWELVTNTVPLYRFPPYWTNSLTPAFTTGIFYVEAP